MVENILESLCGDVDTQILAGKELDSELLLKEHNLYEDPFKSTYQGFIEKYHLFASSTLNEVQQIKSELKNRSAHNSFDIQRVGWNAFWGVVLFSEVIVLDNEYPFVATGAASTVGLTIYDEYSKKNMNLSVLFGGIFFGKFIGNMIDPINSDYFRYLGAACGGAIALVSECLKTPSKLKVNRQKIAALNSRLKKLEDSLENSKRKLIESAIDKVLLLE
ncbi:hypothetical protein J4468_00290 [Candidatus Woesearchaeota archaeon]|nr:hypothetical protein [Candidatus Woesearchaeota archaeon]